MDVQAYLNRIGYTGSLELTAANLSRLVRCHLETVPFENLDSYPKGFPLDNNPEVVFDKVVNHHRGGVCFELNGLFLALLTALGYDCYGVEVRIHIPGRPAAPISHEGIIVTVEGKRFYCDVGFGGPGPKDVTSLDTEAEQLIYGIRYRVRHDGQLVHIQRLSGDTWVPMLTYADTPCIPEDFTARLFYYGMHPGSRFVNMRLVSLCTPDGSKSLTDNLLTIRDGDTATDYLLDEDQIPRILLQEFGLSL